MAYTDLGTQSSFAPEIARQGAQSLNSLTLSADQPNVDLPDASYVRDADILRDGVDLVLRTDEGQVVVEGYFAQNTPPDLVAPDGSTLTPALVKSFVRGEMTFAQSETVASDASPVGAVQEITGEATVTRTDGRVENVGLGTPIYAGDVIETSEDGAVNIVFLDDTTFAVSGDARLAIDEYVFDPHTQSGQSNFSVLKGMFVFTSGLIGREDPDDVMIETPAGSIGIRGTIIAGNVDTGEITVVEGAIVLTDFKGNSITLSNQYETARFDTSGERIEHVGDLSANDVMSKFMSISTVAADLFSTIQDSAVNNNNPQSNNPQNQSTPQAAPEAPTEDKQGALDQPNDVITSADITQSAGAIKAPPPIGQPAPSTTEPVQTGRSNSIGGSGTDALKPPPLADNTEPPPFTLAITKAAFSENVDAQNLVAVIKGNFTQGMGLSLNGISNNFYAVRRVDATTFEVRLKDGIAMDAERPIPLNFNAISSTGTIISRKIDLDILNINEPTTLTNAAPNELFAASSGNEWAYNFANEFRDPEGDIKGYSYTITGLPGGTTHNGASGSARLEISFGTIPSDASATITVDALDANGNVLNSTTKTLDYYVHNQMVAGGTHNISPANQVYTSDGDTNENITIIGGTAKVFTNNGADIVAINSSDNKVHTGGGADTINISSGNGNIVFGGEGADTITMQAAGNKAYGGAGADTVIITAPTVLDNVNTHINGDEGYDTLRLSGSGNIDFTAIDNGRIKNIERVDFNNGGGNTITLSRSDVIAMTDESNTLRIDMDSNDTLNFVNDSGGAMTFYHMGNTPDGHEIYSDGIVTLLISSEGAHNPIM